MKTIFRVILFSTLFSTAFADDTKKITCYTASGLQIYENQKVQKKLIKFSKAGDSPILLVTVSDANGVPLAEIVNATCVVTPNPQVLN